MTLGRNAVPATLSVVLIVILLMCPAEARDSEASYHWMTLAGYHLRFKKDPEKARESLLKALEKDPENFKAVEMLKAVEDEIGSKVREGEFHDIIESGPSFQWYDNALFLWERRRDVKGAIRCLERSLLENPFNTRAAELLQKIRKENSISDDGDGPIVKILSGNREAIEAASRREEANRWVAASDYNLKKQDYVKALAAARKAVELDPVSDDAGRNLKRMEKAQQEHEGLAIRRSSDPSGVLPAGTSAPGPEARAGHWFWLGKYYFAVRGEYTQALECFERTLLLDPSNEDARTMVNRCKAKLFFVSGGTAVKIRDHRGVEERARLAKAIEEDGDAETPVAPDGSVIIKSGAAPTVALPLASVVSKKPAPDPELMKEEEIILVSDYEIEDHKVRQEARRTAVAAGRLPAFEEQEISPYAKWVERKKNFEKLTKSLFANYWKADDSKKTARTDKPPDSFGGESLESSMESVWKQIAAAEAAGFGASSASSEDEVEAATAVMEANDQALRSSTAGLDIVGMKSSEEYAGLRRERLKKAAIEAMGRKTGSFIDSSLAEKYRVRLGRAEEIARTGKRDRALDEYRKVFEEILIKDTENLEALYNLLLLHMDQGNYDFATVVYFKLLGLSGRLQPGSRISREIGELIFCFLKSTIIQSAVAAYNSINKDFSREMAPGTLSVSTLSEAGFLATGGDPYELSLKVFDKLVNVSVNIEDFKCSAGGKYRLRDDGVVECSIHGVGPYVLLHTKKGSDI